MTHADPMTSCRVSEAVTAAVKALKGDAGCSRQTKRGRNTTATTPGRSSASEDVSDGSEAGSYPVQSTG